MNLFVQTVAIILEISSMIFEIGLENWLALKVPSMKEF